jgi:hypothetical protein
MKNKNTKKLWSDHKQMKILFEGFRDFTEGGPPSDQERHYERNSMSADEFAEKHQLQIETDNDGQKIIYMDADQAEQVDFGPGTEGWDVQGLDGGEFVIYTGEYEGGEPPMEEGLHDEGLREMITDFLAQELSGWHDSAKASLHKEIATNGFDIGDIIMQNLGGDTQGDDTQGEEDPMDDFNYAGSKHHYQESKSVKREAFLSALVKEITKK